MPSLIRQLWNELSKRLMPRANAEAHKSSHDMIMRMFQPAVYGTLAQIEQSPDDRPAHVYITFLTDNPGVKLPPHLRLQHPQKMIIVLQHQFFDLTVRDENFSVSLSFNQKEERITVPWSAITRFRDAISIWDVERPAPNPTPPVSPPPGAGDGPKRPANSNVVHIDFAKGRRSPKLKPE